MSGYTAPILLATASIIGAAVAYADPGPAAPPPATTDRQGDDATLTLLSVDARTLPGAIAR